MPASSWTAKILFFLKVMNSSNPWEKKLNSNVGVIQGKTFKMPAVLSIANCNPFVFIALFE